MEYFLKLVNCPVKGLFPVVEGSGQIDWAGAGFNPIELMRRQVQGKDSTGATVSVFPIADLAKLEATGIIETVNNNAYPDDSAAIIDQAEHDIVKADIESVRAAARA